MRTYIDSVAKAVHLGRRDDRRVPRHLRPRTARSTFVPARDESFVRGLSRAA